MHCFVSVYVIKSKNESGDIVSNATDIFIKDRADLSGLFGRLKYIKLMAYGMCFLPQAVVKITYGILIATL